MRATRNLALATLAFTLCFASWSLISPFAKSFKKDLGLSYTQALLLTAVPVVLGSLLRVPVGSLTDRYGGRVMFTVLLAFSALPSILFGYAHGYWALIGVGFLLGVAGPSFAVGVPFVAKWYPPERQGPRSASTGSGTRARRSRSSRRPSSPTAGAGRRSAGCSASSRSPGPCSWRCWRATHPCRHGRSGSAR